MIDYLTANGWSPDTWAGWFTRPSEGAAGLEGDIMALPGEAAAPGMIDMSNLAFAALGLVPEFL